MIRSHYSFRKILDIVYQNILSQSNTHFRIARIFSSCFFILSPLVGAGEGRGGAAVLPSDPEHREGLEEGLLDKKQANYEESSHLKSLAGKLFSLQYQRLTELQHRCRCTTYV